MKEMLDSLKNFLATKSREEVMEIWSSGNYLDKGGLKVTEFLSSKRCSITFTNEKNNFESFKINNNLGSNSYSNLFYLNHSNAISIFQNFELQVH